MWVNGWLRTSRGFELQVLKRQGSSWGSEIQPLHWATSGRVLEPSSEPYARYPSSNIYLKETSLTLIHRLLVPGEVFPRLFDPACRTGHDIFAVEQDGLRILIPALLLIRLLWLWSARAASALLMPGSADIHVGRATDANEVYASSSILSANATGTELRRIAWIATHEDARRSWSSVLTHAELGRLSLTLPEAKLSAWVWGVELRAGLLACELNAPVLTLPEPPTNLRVRSHGTRYTVRPAKAPWLRPAIGPY